MRKLGKKPNLTKETVEAYYCQCNCQCYCGCDCESDPGNDYGLSTFTDFNNQTDNLSGVFMSSK